MSKTRFQPPRSGRDRIHVLGYGLGFRQPLFRSPPITDDGKWHRRLGQQWIRTYGWNIKRRRHLSRGASYDVYYRHKEWLASFFALQSAFDWCEAQP